MPNICHACVGEPVVRAWVQNNGIRGECNYCDRSNRRVVPIYSLAKYVDPVFKRHFARGVEEAVFSEYSDRPVYEERGECCEEVLSWFLELEDDGAARDLANELFRCQGRDDAFYGDECRFTHRSIHYNEFSDTWDHLCKMLKHQRRFFSSDAQEMLGSIFRGILALQDGTGPAIYELGPDNDIYRARPVESEGMLISGALDPAGELGPPPPSIARANRMNPAGVSVFYGAMEAPTCIAELRLPIGDRALVAAFRPIRPLRVMDFTRFGNMHSRASLFADDYERHAAHVQFLQRLGHEISRPIVPREQELNYIPTQALAEYLAWHHDPQIDAVVYASAQRANGKNIVIFNHASRVALGADSGVTEPLSAAYRVTEYLPHVEDDEARDQAEAERQITIWRRRPDNGDVRWETDPDHRAPVLRYVEGSICVYRALASDPRVVRDQVDIDDEERLERLGF